MVESFNFNKHVFCEHTPWLDCNLTGEMHRSWNNGQLYIYLNICILPSTALSQQNRTRVLKHIVLAWWRQFTQWCIYINRKCRGENPAYVSWAKRNAHALRAKSETCKKRKQIFTAEIHVHTLLCWSYISFSSFLFFLYFPPKIVSRSARL